MNRYDRTTSWRRTWAERHPVLYEMIGITLAIVGVAIATLLVAWKL